MNEEETMGWSIYTTPVTVYVAQCAETRHPDDWESEDAANCGWTGGLRLVEADALADADRHRREHDEGYARYQRRLDLPIPDHGYHIPRSTQGMRFHLEEKHAVEMDGDWGALITEHRELHQGKANSASVEDRLPT